MISSWWFQLSTRLKNISQIGSFPQVGMKIKHMWNHHLDMEIGHLNFSPPQLDHASYSSSSLWGGRGLPRTFLSGRPPLGGGGP